jgi:hypothetical protein
VWLSNSPDAGLSRPKNFNGLLLCYSDGLPFYPWSVVSCVVFSAILFGGYYLVMKKSVSQGKVEYPTGVRL